MNRYTEVPTPARGASARSNELPPHKDSRIDDSKWRTGTMSMIKWFIDLLEGLIPIIQIGMEG